MKQRQLGRSGIAVPPLCVGGNVFGWTVDEATSFTLLDAFVDRGLTFIDTADVYSRWAEGHQGGESEAILGRWMKARGTRSKVVLATKVGMDMGEGRVGLKAAYVAQAVEASLTRLQTDHIDLYQSHKDDGSTPQEETLGAYARLIEAGKVRAIGASNFEAPRLKEALDLADAEGLPRYETMQPLYNLYDRSDYEGALATLCAERGVGVIPFYALAAGFLTGKYRSEADLGKSPRGSRTIPKYMNERGTAILAAIDAVAARTGATPASVAIAWVMAKPAIAAPIASATSLAQIDALVAATELTLSAADLAELDAAGA